MKIEIKVDGKEFNNTKLNDIVGRMIILMVSAELSTEKFFYVDFADKIGKLTLHSTEEAFSEYVTKIEIENK
jgi:hypothetical protein